MKKGNLKNPVILIYEKREFKTPQILICVRKRESEKPCNSYI